VGPALGDGGGKSAARYAEERFHQQALFWDQRVDTLGAVIEHGFAGQSWLTFRQALSLGGNVRKGERGTTVVYADRFTPDDERRRAAEVGEEAQAIPFLKSFTVFNIEQCKALPDELTVMAPPADTALILPQAEALIRAA
jgi:antirestriction protein ArdC